MGGGYIPSGGHAAGAKLDPAYYATAAKEIEKTVMERGIGGHVVMPQESKHRYSVYLVVAALVCALVFAVIWGLTQ